jgi:hypothetical protein
MAKKASSKPVSALVKKALSTSGDDEVVYAHVGGYQIANEMTVVMAIDLDNNGGKGPYFHDKGAKTINLKWRHGFIRKSKAADEWALLGATVLAIDDKEAKLAVSGPCGFHPRIGSSDLTCTILENFIPGGFDLSVVDGKMAKMAGGIDFMVLPNVNTFTPIPDPSGNMVIPGVGDYVFIATTPLQSGQKPSGTIDFSVVLAYTVK